MREQQLPSPVGTPRQGHGQGLLDPPLSPQAPQVISHVTLGIMAPGQAPALRLFQFLLLHF